ncbi:MAG: Imm30 family immunity protein [Jaaginema sp. PMC 1079.18]|nr:Imm30 family immunity protein [Jaaginema sp. PMC 1080.18]MEC4850363.1 Imm30 family immunity protein [Jaaginema sp. PMC 1079.18]MEC4867161.1 Imm30 family immunity protein [Jaaginema sp. PMC 1078.18]
MTQEHWINSLKANRLMRSHEEVNAFENALCQLAEHPQNEDLAALHLIFDDRCEQPEVMFSLVHFLESLALEEQLQAFVTVVPQLIVIAPDWTKILHTRILNDEEACSLYREKLRSANASSPHFIRHLLEESASYRLTYRDLSAELAI